MPKCERLIIPDRVRRFPLREQLGTEGRWKRATRFKNNHEHATTATRFKNYLVRSNGRTMCPHLPLFSSPGAALGAYLSCLQCKGRNHPCSFRLLLLATLLVLVTRVPRFPAYELRCSSWVERRANAHKLQLVEHNLLLRGGALVYSTTAGVMWIVDA